jgi:PST family polysaccharide transporter
MGINSSGVRQIAEAAGTGDSLRVARTVTTLRRVALILGGSGALLLAATAPWVSKFSFGDTQHAGAIALLALAVLFGEISAAQGALLQGMRRIADLARFNLWGTLYGAIGSVVIVYFLRERGIVPSLVCLAATNIAVSWWYARKVKVERVALSAAEVRREASGLLTLGVAFMGSTLAGMGAAYLVRIIVLRKLGESEAGYYQAAWTLGGYYVTFILQAMTADFFPRLSSVAHNSAECNRLVNEQAEVGLLIAGPGMLATLALAPLAISLFYAPRFSPAEEVLRWICIGMVLRVIAWPLGSIILAKGLRNLFLWSEILINLIYVAFSWIGVQLFGLKGTGIAFFGMYVVYAIGIYIIGRRVSGFRWSAANCKLALIFTPVMLAAFVCPYLIPSRTWAMVVSGLIAVCLGVYSLRTLVALVPFERLPRPVQRVVALLKLSGPNA